METQLRKSTRHRSMSEHYISVECRFRCPKNRRRSKKITTEIKQEPEDEPDCSSGNLVPSLKLELPTTTTKGPKVVRSTRKMSKDPLKVKIKEEATEKPPGSTRTTVANLLSINDDVEFIQQSIKEEQKVPENRKSKKQREKNLYSDGNNCSSCGRMYKYRKGMLQHQRLECNLEPQFPCPYCPFKFRYRHQIQKHVFEQHNQAFTRWYKLFYLASVNPNPRFVKKEQDSVNQN